MAERMYTFTDVVNDRGKVYSDVETAAMREGVRVAALKAAIANGGTLNGAHWWVERHSAFAEDSRRGRHGTKTTEADRVLAVRMYEDGASFADIGRQLGRTVGIREIKRWNGGVLSERRGGNGGNAT